jgi:hypothetical protein
LFMASTSKIPSSQTKVVSLLCYKVSFFILVITTHIYMLSSVENHWPTLITSHNRLPLFHSFHASCFLTIDELVHHFEL